MPQHAERAGAVIMPPYQPGRREAAGGVALVGIDVGREEQRQLLRMRQQPRQKLLKYR